MKQQEEPFFDDWRDKLAHGKLTAEEAEALQDDPEYREWKLLLAAGRSLKAPAYSEHDAWADFRQQLQHPEQKMTQLRRRRRSIFGIALTILIISTGLIWWFQGRDRVYTTPAGQNDRFTLPDGTGVHMHVASTLTWDPDRWWSARGRVIAFSGQAFFRHDDSDLFTLLHSNGQLTARRATFDVRIRGPWLHVSCYAGRVTATVRGQTHVIPAGTTARWDGARWSQRLIPGSQQAPSWMDGTTTMQQMPLSEVVRELERLYQVSIDLNASPDPLFSGSFPNYDLSQALGIVCDRMELKPTFYPGNFIILDPDPRPEEEDSSPVRN